MLPQGVKTAFELTIDEMTGLTVRRSYEAIKTNDADFVVQVQNSSILSNMVPYFRKKDSKNIVYGVASFIILLDKGIIKEIVSEDLGAACSNSEAPSFVGGFYNAIAQTEKKVCPYECNSGDNDTGKCDLKVFVSWIGTDKNGVSLISSSGKLSNFANFNLQSMYDNIMAFNTDPMVDDKAIKFDPNVIDEDAYQRM